MRDHTDTPIGRLARWFDVRLGAAEFTTSKLNYVFPKHFTFLFGEIALYAFVVLVATGVFLALFYSPSEAEVVYGGDYQPLVGLPMSEAYESVVELSFSVRAGLLMRQTHHWAALVFMGAIFAHMARVFFTGAFRRPRELNWVTGVVLMMVGMLEGFAGYSLLDDLLSGTGVRIAYSVVEGIPVVGAWAAFLAFGGEYPGEGFLSRLFTVHVFLMPAILAGLITVHLALVARQHHTQFPGPGKSEHNVVGHRMWPTYATLSGGLFFLIAAVLTLMGGTLQINPVWLYGPYDLFTVTSGAQADYYVLWLQGLLRLMPGWEVRAFGYTITNQFFPGVLVPGIVFGVFLAWPWLEARVTGDRRSHHLLDRPRDRPVRTAIGMAGLTGFVVTLVAGSDDVIAATFDWSIVALRYTERVLLFALPAAVALLTYRVCADLSARGEPAAGPEEAASGPAVATAGPGEGRAATGGGGVLDRLAAAPVSRATGAWRRLRRALVTTGMVAAVVGALADRLRNGRAGR
ncbi:MAG: ubiquinol-cytochrome c reductase cytochrome b subunit [Actinobacteria bacterium]|nr:ubiquinol-cytochrome c reductase cytochrome b subunit [Actinomycetota bacterium]